MTSEKDSNEQAEVTEPEVQPYNGETPGQLLREAREAKGLTTQQMADSLRLRRAVVEMIEADEYEKLASATFVRGYLRSFSKALEVDEDRVFKAYAAMGYGDIAASSIKMQSFSKRKVRERNDNRLMIISYFIIAIVIALAVVWWWQSGNGGQLFSNADNGAASQRVQDEDEVSAVQGRVTESAARRNVQTSFADNAAERADADSSAADAGDLGASSDSEGLGSDTDMSDAELSAVSADLSAADSTAGSSGADSNVASSDAVGSDSSEAGSESNAAGSDSGAADSNADLANADPTNTADLNLEFSGECWVKVADATGETLAIGVKNTGYSMPLSGTPPFELILCKPEFVTLTYNGEPVDLSEYRRNRSVTLTLN